LEPGIFSDLPNLEELHISKNALVELDKNLFKNLKALKKLFLSFNKIIK
jgi:Leucine-rich repeat (LRR) protein